MKKSFCRKLIIIILVILICITVIILFSEKVQKILFIENIKQVLKIRRK